MILWVYDKWGNQKKALKWVFNFVHDDEIGNLDFIEFDLIGEAIDKYDYIVWQDEFFVWHEHFVRETNLNHSEGKVIQHVYAVNSIAELNLSYIDERDSYNFSNAVAWSRLLDGTRWTIGIVENLGLNDVKFYHTTVYEGAVLIMEKWGGDLSTKIMVGSQGVIQRSVNHEAERGEDNGLLFTYGFDMGSIQRKIELDDVYTKIHVFGKGEPTFDDSGSQTGNGRRISFADINGGKDYVEDNIAKEKWGIEGKNGWQHSEGTFVFDQVEDKEILLELAKEKLKEVSKPRLTYTASVAMLKAAGMEFKNAKAGDKCYIRDKVINERLSGRIIHVRRFVDKPAEITLGNIVRTVNDVVKGQQKQINSLQSQSTRWSSAAEANREWLNNMVDHLNEQMNESGGFVYWEQGDGITVYDRKKENNPTMAIQLKGAGFRIANSKKSNGEWDWRTFGTGDGFTADLINVGSLVCGQNRIDLDSGTVTFVNGVIQDLYSNNYWNLGTGEFRLAYNTKIGEKTVSQYVSEGVSDFVNEVYDPKIAQLQAQIDGQIETWYYDYEPKLTNKPASDWNTEAKKEAHEGDLFYWKSKGYAYRFFKDGSTWKWQPVQDTDITLALGKAAEAQDTADAKRRVFVSQPTPPYDIGDLWTQGADGDLMRCAVGRKSGDYVKSDWVLATKYTDDTALNTFKDTVYSESIKEIQGQLDGKAETWYQSADPSSNWKTADQKTEHKGDIWVNSTTGEGFIWTGSAWESMESEIPQELIDKVDGKAQVFVGEDKTGTRPKPPYYERDLWFLGENGGIKTCVKTRLTGSYTASDWAVKNNYIDEAAASQAGKDAADAAINSMTQEQVFNKLTDGGKAKGLFLESNQLYINGDYIQTGVLTSSGGSSWNLNTGDFTTIFTISSTVSSSTTTYTRYTDQVVEVDMGATKPFSIYRGSRTRTVYKNGDPTVYGTVTGKQFAGGLVLSSETISIGASDVYLMASRVGMSNLRYITTGVTNDGWTGFTFHGDEGTYLQLDGVRSTATPTSQKGANGLGFQAFSGIFMDVSKYSRFTRIVPPTTNDYESLNDLPMVYITSNSVLAQSSSTRYFQLNNSSVTLQYSATRFLSITSTSFNLTYQPRDTTVTPNTQFRGLNLTSSVAGLYFNDDNYISATSSSVTMYKSQYNQIYVNSGNVGAYAGTYTYLRMTGNNVGSVYIYSDQNRYISMTSSAIYIYFDNNHYLMINGSTVAAQCGNNSFGCFSNGSFSYT